MQGRRAKGIVTRRAETQMGRNYLRQKPEHSSAHLGQFGCGIHAGSDAAAAKYD